MTRARSVQAILLFGPKAAILPSRPIFASPARTAKVKGGAAGAPRRASPLTAGRKLAALLLSAASTIFVFGRHE